MLILQRRFKYRADHLSHYHYLFPRIFRRSWPQVRLFKSAPHLPHIPPQYHSRCPRISLFHYLCLHLSQHFMSIYKVFVFPSIALALTVYLIYSSNFSSFLTVCADVTFELTTSFITIYKLNSIPAVHFLQPHYLCSWHFWRRRITHSLHLRLHQPLRRLLLHPHRHLLLHSHLLHLLRPRAASFSPLVAAFFYLITSVSSIFDIVYLVSFFFVVFRAVSDILTTSMINISNFSWFWSVSVATEKI